MHRYAIYHGMDDEQTHRLAVAVFGDDGRLVRVEGGQDEVFADSIASGLNVQEMASRFKSWTFAPEQDLPRRGSPPVPAIRLNPEPDWVIERVATETGTPPERVRDILSDAHHVVDRFVADDNTVILDPLLFRRSGEPIFPKVMERFTTSDWRDPLGLKALDEDGLALELGVDVDLVVDHPVVFAWRVLAQVLAWRELDWDDAETEEVDAVLHAWRATFDKGNDIDRRYRVSHVGLERDFERWLLDNLAVLYEAGYPVKLVDQQVRLPTGRVLDLLCEVTHDLDPLRVGDLVVIENKATAVGIAAHAQLLDYVDTVRRHRASGNQQAYGVLIADGSTLDLRQALRADGLGYLSLAELGYRDYLYRHHLLTQQAETSDLTEQATTVTSLPDLSGA